MTDWGHVSEMVITAVGSSVPILLYIMSNKRKAKKDADSRAEATHRETIMMHQENSEKLDAVLSERQYLKPHDHIETTGPLDAEGIIRKRNGGMGL